MDVQLRLTTNKVPFVVTSGLKFFEMAHIKDFCAYLRLAYNPLDESAFDRLVKMLPGVGDVAAEKLWQQWCQTTFARQKRFPYRISNFLTNFKVPPKAQEDWNQMAWTMDEFTTKESELHPPAKLMHSIWEGLYKGYLESSYENADQREQDLEQFRLFGGEFETLEAMLNELSLISGPESAEATAGKKDDSVVLSSIHQAKGLEWKVVFLISLGDAMFPSPKAIENGGIDALEEERRLFYVGVTRAMDQLYLTYPRSAQRSWEGPAGQGPSQFISELNQNLMDRWRIG
jgi:DNA helicase II / ATP-dependent DNA helicase PcrA